MANLITGNLFKLLYSDDPANNLPVGAGVYEITNLAAMPTLQLNSTQVNYETYDSTYTTVLLSNKNISPFEIIVNYVPDEASTVYLDNKQDSRDLFQVILNYRQTDGTIDYAAVAGYITAGSVTGSKDEVVRKTYTFTPQDLVVSLRTIDSLEPLYEGSYGVGSNGTDVPQYQPVTPEGNSFIKVPSGQTGNPAGADMMGIGLVDGTSVAEFAMTKSGTLSLYAKNATTAWTRILTATQIQSQYVPINRTVNGKALTNNITIDKSDVGLGNVTNDAQLTIANNLSDLESVDTARANLNVYSKTTVDTKVATVQTSADSKLAKASNLSDLADKAAARTNLSVYSKAESDAGYMARAKNLSDVVNVATARTNLGLGTAAVQNIGTSGNTIPLLSGTNTWTNPQAFNASSMSLGGTTTSTGVGFEIGSTNTAGTSYIDFHSSGTTSDYDGRISVGGGSATALGNMYFYAANVNIPTLALTNDLSLEHGGTGASNYDQALINLNAMKFQRSSLSASDNLNSFDGTNPGFYYCSMNVAATTANNYPVQQAGSLLVMRNGANGVAGCTQMYFPYSSNDIYVRTYYVASPSSWSDWNIILQKGSYGLGIDLTAQASTPIANLGELTPTGFYYTSNESTLGGVTSDTTYVLTNRGGRPTTTASKYVQQRTWNGYFMGSNGWTWREQAQLESSQTFTGNNTFNGTSIFSGYITNNAANPFAIRSQNPTLSFVESDASESAYMFVADGGNFRLNRDNTGGTQIFGYTRNSNTSSFGTHMAVSGDFQTGASAIRIPSAANTTSPGVGTGGYRAIEAGGDYAGFDNMNNINITSWYGIGFCTAYTSPTSGVVSGKPAVYINTRTGTLAARNAVYANTTQLTSDRNAKENIEEISDDESEIEKILGLKTYTFNFKNSGQPSAGFIAQEVAEVFPDYVQFVEDINHYSLDYTAVSAYTHKAVVHYAAKTKVLEAKVEDQQAQIDELKTLVQQLLNQDK